MPAMPCPVAANYDGKPNGLAVYCIMPAPGPPAIGNIYCGAIIVGVAKLGGWKNGIPAAPVVAAKGFEPQGACIPLTIY